MQLKKTRLSRWHQRLFFPSLLLLLASILSTSILHAQQKLTVEDAILGARKQFAVKKLRRIAWIDEDHFSHVKEKKVFRYNIKTQKQEVAFELETLNKALKAHQLPELTSIPSFKWQDFNTLRYATGKQYLYHDLLTDSISNYLSIPNEAQHIDFAPSDSAVAYIKARQVHITTTTEDRTITDFQNPNIVVGQAVSRHEFGIRKGFFWSPDSKKLAFYYKDEKNVSEYPIVDYTASPAKVSMLKYPRNGEASEIVRVGIYNLETKRLLYINEQDTVGTKYLTNLTWSPDSKKLYIQELSRNQKEMQLQEYLAETGELSRSLLTETHPKYVEPEHPLLFLPDSSAFIYQSERDGFNHLYKYELDSGKITQLTQGDWVVTEVIKLCESKQELYYISTQASELERHLYKLDLQTGISTKLTNVPGAHRVTLSPNQKHFIDQYSNVNTPGISLLASTTNGRTVATLEKSQSPFVDMEFPKMSIGQLKSSDGSTKLQVRVILPTDFNPKKKYPALVYVYGGPHAQLITNSWLGGARLWLYYMAQQGYVVFTLDNRGSANRGFEFESAVHKQLGKLEMQDQLQGLKYLKSLKYVDKNRIGVFGWSFGGYMTLSLLLNYPDAFKLGVAGGPVTDWRFYEIMYGERYMETEATNPEGFAQTSLLDKAGKLKSKLLMIHGSKDPVVVQEHSARMLREFVKASKPVDYMIYPAHEHNVRGKDRVHLMEKISQYFFDNMK